MIEKDPHGKDQHEPGAKADAGKLRMSVVLKPFSRALAEVAKVGTYGANKYTDGGWQHVPNGIERYSDSLLRHIFAGSLVDDETQLLHDAHAAWNALAVLELKLRSLEDSGKMPSPAEHDVSLSGVAILGGEQERNGAVCVRCGAEFIYTGVKPDFCGHCMRIEMDECREIMRALFITGEGVREEQHDKLCQNCGHERGDGDEWCSRCGQHYD